MEFGSPGDIYSHSDADFQTKYYEIHDVQTSKTCSLYLREYDQLKGNLKWIADVQDQWTAPLSQWLHSKGQAMESYVQWGKIKEIPIDVPSFAARVCFHSYADYNLILGNAEANEALSQIKANPELPDTKINEITNSV